MMEQSKLSGLRASLKDTIEHGNWEDVYDLLVSLRDSGDIFELFPILKELDCRETIDGVNHKNVLEHTYEVLRNLRDILTKEYEENGDDYYKDGDNALVLGTLLHDIGKAKTKKFDKVKKTWTYYAHEEVGYEIAKPMLDKLDLSKHDEEVILTVIRYHQLPGQLEEIGDKGLRRFCSKVGLHLREIMLIAKADSTSNNPMKVLKCRQKVDDLYEKIKDFIKREEARILRVDITNADIVALLGVDVRCAAGIKEMLKELVLTNTIINSKEEIANYLKRRFKNE